MSSTPPEILTPIHHANGSLLGHAELELAHRLLELGMLSRGPDGDLRAADEEHVELVEEFLEVAADETALVPAEQAAPENMLPLPGVEFSRRAEFDSDTGIAEFTVRLEGLDTGEYLELFESVLRTAPRRAGSRLTLELAGSRAAFTGRFLFWAMSGRRAVVRSGVANATIPRR